LHVDQGDIARLNVLIFGPRRGPAGCEREVRGILRHPGRSMILRMIDLESRGIVA